MTITIQLADDLTQHADFAREAVEGLALGCYRTGTLTPRQCQALLGLSRIEFDGFLKRHGVEEGAYDVEDLERDLKLIRELGEPRLGAH